MTAQETDVPKNDLSSQLTRILRGEKPEDVLGIAPNLTPELFDFGADFTSAQGIVAEKKKIVYILRAAATLDVAKILQQITPSIPLPDAATIVDDEVTDTIGNRMLEVFDSISPITLELQKNPDPKTQLLPNVYNALSNYLPPDFSMVTSVTMARLRAEQFMRKVIPAYVVLLRNVVERDGPANGIPIPIDFATFQQLLCNSMSIIERGAVSHHNALDNYVDAVFTDRPIATFHPEMFALRGKIAGAKSTIRVGLTPQAYEIMKQCNYMRIPRFVPDVVYGCPAHASIEQSENLDFDHAERDLIRTIIMRGST